MKLLFCAATQMELECLPSSILQTSHTLVSGVGIPLTLCRTLSYIHQYFAQEPVVFIQIGIAGAFPKAQLEIGSVVQVVKDSYGDLGFELPHSTSDTKKFTPIQASPWMEGYPSIYQFSTLPQCELLPVTAITVNTCTGTEATAQLRVSNFNADLETMEGAAIAQVLRPADKAFQIRSVSNRVGTRDIDSKKIQLALSTLKEFCYKYPWDELFKLASWK